MHNIYLNKTGLSVRNVKLQVRGTSLYRRGTYIRPKKYFIIIDYETI